MANAALVWVSPQEGKRAELSSSPGRPTPSHPARTSPSIGHELLDLRFHLLVADRCQPAVLFVLIGDPAGELVDLDLADPMLALEAEELVDPMGNAVGAALVGDGDAGRPAQKLGRIENVVDPLVRPQPAGVDAGAGGVEQLPTSG